MLNLFAFLDLSGTGGLKILSCFHRVPMRGVFMTEIHGRAAMSICALLLMAGMAGGEAAHAAGCDFEPQGDGHVAAIIDGRTFRLQDGREIRLAGIETVFAEDPARRASRRSALAAILTGQDVTLRGPDDAPDRYGRQSAFVFLNGGETSVQNELLSHGAALLSAEVANKDCDAVLTAAEATARQAKQGVWADSTVIKSSENPGDILAAIGRFTLVEGKVLSVRQAGATTYLNFGRNWTRDFAVTISRRVVASFEAAGIVLKSFENRRIRVRGWVEARGGPRMEVLRVGQIELAE
jgi:endonuclease YncB( thermonuclease family)